MTHHEKFLRNWETDLDVFTSRKLKTKKIIKWEDISDGMMYDDVNNRFVGYIWMDLDEPIDF